MITVEVIEYRPSSKDAIEGVIASTLNIAAKKFSDILKDRVKGKVCPNHPSANQLIRVKVSRPNKNFSVEKSRFCCEDFKNSIQIHVK